MPEPEEGAATGGMAHNKVVICGVNTSKLKVLKNEEINRLLKETKAGSKSARDELISGNLRLVLSVIQRFTNRGEAPDDLFQVGCIGLIKAIENFKTEIGVRFSTYAVPMILGELRRYLRDNNAIRVSRSIRDTAYKAFAVRSMLAERNHEEPTIDDIAKEMGITVEETAFAIDAVQDPISLSQPVYQDGGDVLYVLDGIADEKNSDERWFTSLALKDAVDKLDEKERRIVFLRYFKGKTQMEVANEIGISQAQVSRLEKSAINSMRKDYL